MRTILRSIHRIVSSALNRAMEVVRSNRQELKTAPRFLRVLAFTGVFVFAWAIFSFALHAFVVVLSVTINSIFINRLLNTEAISKNKIVQDFSKPVIGMGVFALASLLYFLVPELTIVLSFFVIPQLFGEVGRKYEEYQHALA